MAIEPNILLQASFQVELGLRPQYFKLTSAAAPSQGAPVPIAPLVKQTAELLELVLVGAFLFESLTARGGSLARLTPEVASEVREQALAMYGLDPGEVFEAARKHLPVDPTQTPDFEPSLEALVRAMNSLLASCPIEQIEQLAMTHHIEAFGHRCRIAYDGIKAFVLRNGSSEQAQISVLGHAYVRGSLSIDDVATLLELHPVDAVALLESHGFNRRLEQIALHDSRRTQILSRMREDRLARTGEPAWTNESIARDVVASERLEGVDARRWIPRDGQ
jgi:hypothetical protein